MSEEDLPDAEQFRLERERAQREQAEWPRRLEKLCREAEAHWRAAHPWLADPNMCVSVPIPRLDLPDPQGPRSFGGN